MKFKIKDDYGKEFEVEEIQDDELETNEEIETIDDDEIKMENEEVHDDESLSSEEISALKKLAGVVDKLLALIPVEEEEHGTLDEEEEEIDETIEDADEEEFVEEDKEEVIDTDSMRDSIGSVERKKSARDSKIDAQEQIANKWQENYSKFNK